MWNAFFMYLYVRVRIHIFLNFGFRNNALNSLSLFFYIYVCIFYCTGMCVAEFKNENRNHNELRKHFGVSSIYAREPNLTLFGLI